MGGSTGGHCPPVPYPLPPSCPPPPTLETHFGECPLGLWALFCITKPIVVSQIRCSLPYSDRLKALRSSSKMTIPYEYYTSACRPISSLPINRNYLLHFALRDVLVQAFSFCLTFSYNHNCKKIIAASGIPVTCSVLYFICDCDVM